MTADTFEALLPQPMRIVRTPGASPPPRRVRIVTEGLDREQDQSFSRLSLIVLKDWLAAGGKALSVQVVLARGRVAHDEAYQLDVGRSVTLAARRYAGLLRGIQTLKQLLEEAADAGTLPHCRITDSPRLPSRGIHYDLAREMECRPAHLRRIIEHLAYLRMNTLHLYLENKFAFPSCPQVAPPGVMTPAQARELVRYAALFGITIIPQIATLGHVEHFLHGELARLREDPANPFNICPTHPDTRPLLAGFIRDVAEAFRPPFIHVGYDESHSGVCERCRQHGTPQQILADHLNWLNAEVKKHGARTMIYGDKFLSHEDFPHADAVNGGTSAEARAALARVERDIVITDWHYTAPWGGTTEYLIRQGFEVHTCCATNLYWHDSIPLTRSSHWIAETIEQGIRAGATGAFNANWEFYRGQFLDNFWYFQALAAERTWSARPHDYASFGCRFSRRFWGVPDDIYGAIASLAETVPTCRRKLFLDCGALETEIQYSLGVLYPFSRQTLFDHEELGEWAIAQARRLRREARRNRDTLRMLHVPGEMIRYIGLRARQRLALERALKAGDRQAAFAALSAIRRGAEHIASVLEAGYRLYGGAVQDRGRVAAQIAGIDRAIQRLKESERIEGMTVEDLVKADA